MTLRGLVAFGHHSFASEVGDAVNVHLAELFRDDVVDTIFEHVAVAPGDVAPDFLINNSNNAHVDIVVIVPPVRSFSRAAVGSTASRLS